MELEDLHTCELSEGKIVNIEVDVESGDTYCGYCGKKVDYATYFEENMPDTDLIEEAKEK